MSNTSTNTAGQGAAVATGQWTLDPDRSSVDISHRHFWGLSKVKGSFARLQGSGRVTQDGSVSGTFSVDAASVDTKNKKRDDHLRSDDFFNVADHPQITFEARAARTSGATGFVVDGVLTAGGVSRPMQVPVTVRDLENDALTVEATLAVDRKAHGMTWNKLGVIRGDTRVHAIARFVRSGGEAR